MNWIIWSSSTSDQSYSLGHSNQASKEKTGKYF